MTIEKELSAMRQKKEGSCDISEEITLEDYMPEAKKILFCKETVSPPVAYVGKDELELAGAINMRLLYVGADNRLYAASFADEYGIEMRCDGDMQGKSIRCLTAAASEGTSARLLSPRKISQKARITASAAATSAIEKEECVIEEFIPSSCEALTEAVRAASSYCASGEMIELYDEYIPGSGSERIILSDCSFMITNAHADDGMLSARGELIIDVLVCDDEGLEMPRTVRRKLPFSQELECPDAKKSDRLSVVGCCTELKITSEETRVLISACCRLDYIITFLCEKKVCTDVFSPTNALKVSENKIRYLCNAYSANANLSISGSSSLSELGLSPSFGALTACGTANVSELCVIKESGKGILSGECRFRAVFFNDAGEAPEFEARDISAPFRYEFPYESEGSHHVFCHSASLSGISLRADGEKVAINAELSIAFTAASEAEMNVISDISVGEELKNRDGSIRIIYPQAEASLWSVAKSYRQSISLLCSQNGISPNEAIAKPSSLSGHGFIII